MRGLPTTMPFVRFGAACRACALLLACWWGALGFAYGQEHAPVRAQVLVLVSYHVGMPWSDAQVQGLRDELAGAVPAPELMLHYLDTKRVQRSERYYAQWEALLQTKYADAVPDVVVAIDDDALDFALRLRKSRYPQTPIVFSGVASSRRSVLQLERALGGVFDDLDVPHSLARLLELMPQVRRVVVLHDQSRTGMAQAQTLDGALPKGVALETWTGMSVAQIQRGLRALNAQDLVLALPFNRDIQGRLLSHEEAAALWGAAATAPVVVTRDVAMPPGVLGGFVVSGYGQGQSAGRMVLRQLYGGSADTLSLQDAAAQAVFDYNQLQRWSIPRKALPPDARLLGVPADYWESLRPHLPWLSVLFGSLLVIIALLLYVLRVRQQAAQALAQSARNYQSLFDNSPDAIIVRDMQSGLVVQTNPRFNALFGYDNAEVLNLGMGQLSMDEAPFDAERLRAWYDKVLRDGPQSFEWKSRRKDGSVFWSEVSLTQFDQAHGQRAVASVRDISDRKQAEALRLEFEHGMQQVFQNLPVAVFAIDTAHRVTYWNPHLARLTGVTSQAVVGKRRSWLGIHASEQATLADALLDGFSPDVTGASAYGDLRPHATIAGAWEGEAWYAQLDQGRGMWMRVCAAELRNTHGAVVGALQTFIDVTPLKRAQAVLEDLNRDLERRVKDRTAELQQAMAQLVESEKLAALGSLVAGVAHELNTPLGVLTSVSSTLQAHIHEFGERLLSGALRRAEAHEYAQQIQEAGALVESNAQKAAALVVRFKEIAVDQSHLQRCSFRLKDVVAAACALTHDMLAPAGHTFALELEDGIELDSYPISLEQVFTNLIANAVLHGFEQRTQCTLEIRARTQQDTVHIEIRDYGVGIAADRLPRIFEPFFTSKLGRGSSGLGLYVVHNLVTHVLGGAIRAESTLGQGTVFCLELPRTAPQR